METKIVEARNQLAEAQADVRALALHLINLLCHDPRRKGRCDGHLPGCPVNFGGTCHVSCASIRDTLARPGVVRVLDADNNSGGR